MENLVVLRINIIHLQEILSLSRIEIYYRIVWMLNDRLDILICTGKLGILYLEYDYIKFEND